MPLVKGHYPLTNPLQSILGLPSNAVQANIPVRTNAEYLGLASAADGAALVTNKLVCVAVPVDVGQTYSTVTFVAGATAPTVTINYAAVYAGMGTAALSTLLAQSTNAGATAPTASQADSYTLATPQVATAANAPYGFWFVGIQGTGTVNSALSVSVAAAVDVLQAAVFTHSPFALGFSVAATTGTAPATLASPTTVALKPIVFLS
jgi:hypothetical protein